MITPNHHYAELKDSYLFARIAQKVSDYQACHPDAHLLRMGIGDVSLPLCDAVIAALHQAVDDQADKDRFQGYLPECGAPFLREAITGGSAQISGSFTFDEANFLKNVLNAGSMPVRLTVEPLEPGGRSDMPESD